MAIILATSILSTALLIQTQEIVWKKAELGQTVTLHCAFLSEVERMLYWYKQSLGYCPQMVASRYVFTRIQPSFTRVTVGEGDDFNLTITNVQKEDEASYFCKQGGEFKETWNYGVFLTVKDHKAHRFVSQTVVQQPELASAQLGDPVTLHCSVTSQRTDHRNQCQGEPSVYWFRPGSGPSHPAAIYMNGNRSGECQDSSGSPSAPQSCVYNLPKNNVGPSDTGTYYCALAACGQVVFGPGTKLDITEKEPNYHLVFMVVAILEACFLAGIIIVFLIRNKKLLCEQHKGTLRACNQVPRDSVIQEQQEVEADPLNYAALEFSGRKTQRGKKNSDTAQEGLYSAVRETRH